MDIKYTIFPNHTSGATLCAAYVSVEFGGVATVNGYRLLRESAKSNAIYLDTPDFSGLSRIPGSPLSVTFSRAADRRALEDAVVAAYRAGQSTGTVAI